MSEQWIFGIATGIGVGIGLAIHQSRQSKKNASLSVQITAALGAKGPRTLAELSEDVGLPGFMGRGKVTLALGEMQQSGAVVIIEAPEGTPQLKKVDFIRYRLPDGAPPPSGG
ncbi:MAG: hypothetical protein Q8S73_12285 [Deltaproteobacteria bacterium]|nr:hypothetical protein [Myxococcales bacterium]MDP3214877.1 hypothetical protein [Deltaproteobacteria bacterium]